MFRVVVALGVLTSSALACLGGGSGGNCCPPSASSCGPSVPPCSSSSYGSGGPAYPPPPPPPPAHFGGSYASAPALGGGPVGGYAGPAIGGGSYQQAPAPVIAAPAQSFQQGGYQQAPAPVGGFQQTGAGGAYASPVAPSIPAAVNTQVETVATGPAIVSPQVSIDQPAPAAYAEQPAAAQQPVTQEQVAPVETAPSVDYEAESAEAPAPAATVEVAPAPAVEYKEQPAPVEQVQTVEEVHEEAPAPVVEEPAPVVEASPSPAPAEESTYDDIVEEQEHSAAIAPAKAADYDATQGENYKADEETDEGNCDDAELRAIVEGALGAEKDNLEAARKIEGDASAKFGGRFNSIVSDAEFAYVNWYGKRNCQLRIENRHSLTWED